MTTDTTTAAADTTTATTTASTDGSLLQTGATTTTDTTTAAATPGPNDWLPAKFHTNNEAGEFDEAASARKLAESYRSLEAHKGPVMKAPETPEGYKITAPVDKDGKPIDGFDVDAFMKDPLFTGLATKAHAKGIPNEHLEFFVHEYLDIAPQMLEANKQLTIEEASSELSKVWTDKATFDANLSKAHRATTEFAKGIAADQPGSFERLDKKFGSDPDFVALMARIGAESKFGEDTPANNATATSDVDVEALMKGPAYWDPNHADHAKVKAQVTAHFTRVHGTAAHR